MTVPREPLAVLRERLRGCTHESEIEAWLPRLREDPRAGARGLAETWERRLLARRAERERLGRLLARTRALRAAGALRVAGVDEVGVGPLAGPVVAAAVVLPDDAEARSLSGLDDSKRVSRSARERLAAELRRCAVDIGIGRVEPGEIDRLNIHRAGLLAMRRAVAALAAPPDHLLVDARRVPGVDCEQTPIVGGDGLEAPIAAASIVAKVYRDAVMVGLEDRHPGYGFARHMGYGTAEHMDALRRLGPSPIHRRSFAPVAAAARR
ncbi:MAG: ribonuclease HII [Myxococcota bacterium]